MLTVPFAERAIYEMADGERTPEHVLRTLRRIESSLQGLNAGSRPVLAIPHLLSGESSAYYHGYVLAEMAVYQTRQHLVARDGYLTDNPRIGRELAEHYWAPGNAVPFDHTVRALTGRSLGADALAHECNRTIDEAIENARALAARTSPRQDDVLPVLDATIHVVHGRERVASTDDGGIDGLCDAFETWVRREERNAASTV